LNIECFKNQGCWEPLTSRPVYFGNIMRNGLELFLFDTWIILIGNLEGTGKYYCIVLTLCKSKHLVKRRILGSVCNTTTYVVAEMNWKFEMQRTSLIEQELIDQS
jgi:hypothetical protein